MSRYLDRLAERREDRALDRARRDSALAIAESYRGKYYDLAERTVEDLRTLLVAPEPDIVECLKLMKKLDTFDIDIVEAETRGALREALQEVKVFTERALQHAFKNVTPWNEDRPYDNACRSTKKTEFEDGTKAKRRSRLYRDVRRKVRRKRRELEECGFVCPKCGDTVTSTRQWHTYTGRMKQSCCLKCHYAASHKKPGPKRKGEPPSDNVCPRCGKERKRRRQWALETRPVICKRCNEL